MAIMAQTTEEALDVSKTRHELREALHAARQSGHMFLIYLLALALEELTNIENGRATEF